GWMTRVTGPWPSSKARTSVPSAETAVIIVTPTRHRAYLGRAYRYSRCRACATRPKANRSADARAGPKLLVITDRPKLTGIRAAGAHSPASRRWTVTNSITRRAQNYDRGRSPSPPRAEP